MEKVQGLIAAAFTPFHEDGSINYGLIPALTDKLVADGLRGIFVCGSNGEGPNMTTAERMEVAAAFTKAANKRLLIFVHVGHSSIAEARTLAAHAQQIGADAISAVAAFYFKPTSVQNLADSMAQIAAAAPELPFYYYHIPHLTGVGMDMVQFLEIAGPAIPNLAGIKYTATTLQEYQACLQYEGGKYDILYGLDEMLLPAMAVGAQGAIGSTYTFAAPLYLQTMEAFRKGDMERARTLHAYMVEVVRILVKYPPIPGQKAIMRMLGWDLGPCRLPLTTFSEAASLQFRNELAALSFFDKAPARKVIHT
ncbi:dihydrodipicolinate synthase family protein [Chitinophaga alhagiae]|uniref:dihydrodipicolinate synthase family protein n=1 Tax=Chitinophaga alhagiae TaxID=2203219 RepID=UPI000E5C2679|nr:dihydrodipicolinate synthase family protein [Chitinophaga alhagiae]